MLHHYKIGENGGHNLVLRKLLFDIKDEIQGIGIC